MFNIKIFGCCPSVWHLPERKILAEIKTRSFAVVPLLLEMLLQ